MPKGKKIALTVVALLLIAACVAAVVLIPRTPKEEVKVYSFDMMGYESYYYGGTESYGMVTTDRVQSVYVTETQNITEIKVYAGQEVKKGDVLYTYDTTLTDLSLERKDLSIQQMEANLKTAQKELTALKSMKPMVIPNEPDDDDVEKSPSNSNMLGKIYNGGSANGTGSKPYRVWIRSSTKITQEQILEYLKTRDEEMRYEVYVIFGVASSTNQEYSYEYGVKYKLEEATMDVAFDVTIPTEPTEPEPTVPADPDPTESTEAAVETPDKESETGFETGETAETPVGEIMTGSEPEVPAENEPAPLNEEEEDNKFTYNEEVTYNTIDMTFFVPSTASNDNIQYNSGYTSSELAAMKEAKQAEISELQFNIKIGKAELAIMKQEAESGEVVAELNGTVGSVLEPANALAMNQPMIKVMGGGGFYVEGSVSELDLATVQVGQTVTVTSWDTYMTYEGVIQSVGTYPTEDGNAYSYGSTNVSYYPYTVFIDEAADLQEGMYVSMTYQAQSQEQEGDGGLLYLENAFILEENGRHYVFARNDEGLLEKREIQVGENDGYSSVILSGVSMTDYLAFPYARDAVEGAPTVEGTWDDLYGY